DHAHREVLLAGGDARRQQNLVRRYTQPVLDHAVAVGVSGARRRLALKTCTHGGPLELRCGHGPAPTAVTGQDGKGCAAGTSRGTPRTAAPRRTGADASDQAPRSNATTRCTRGRQQDRPAWVGVAPGSPPRRPLWRTQR